MRELILIRHGVTTWNRDRRIQGQTDVALSTEGADAVRDWKLPHRYRDAQWFISPLRRTGDTARLLGIESPTPVDALMEMDWGEWTGRRIEELRAELGEAMRENEGRGLDFTPPGGESPRMVRDRLSNWLATVDSATQPIGIVTHKGVIRAAISLATGWDLRSDYSEKLRRETYHRFHLNDNGKLILEQLNLPLLVSVDTK